MRKHSSRIITHFEVINERFTVVVEKEENKVRLRSTYTTSSERWVRSSSLSFKGLQPQYRDNNIYNPTHKEVGYRAFRTVWSNNFKTLGKFIYVLYEL